MVVAERAPWQNPRIVTTLLLVFLAGASAGALSMKMGLHNVLHRSIGAGAREPGRDAVVQRFRTELQLTGAQADQIAAVLEDYRKYYQTIQDQLEDIRATGKGQIMRILNPEQREKFEKMMGELVPQMAPAPTATPASAK
jgi:Spy/CpxP family protein refolding chaperone